MAATQPPSVLFAFLLLLGCYPGGIVSDESSLDAGDLGGGDGDSTSGDGDPETGEGDGDNPDPDVGDGDGDSTGDGDGDGDGDSSTETGDQCLPFAAPCTPDDECCDDVECVADPNKPAPSMICGEPGDGDGDGDPAGDGDGDCPLGASGCPCEGNICDDGLFCDDMDLCQPLECLAQDAICDGFHPCCDGLSCQPVDPETVFACLPN
jgi:hypothetical protein